MTLIDYGFIVPNIAVALSSTFLGTVCAIPVSYEVGGHGLPQKVITTFFGVAGAWFLSTGESRETTLVKGFYLQIPVSPERCSRRLQWVPLIIGQIRFGLGCQPTGKPWPWPWTWCANIPVYYQCPPCANKGTCFGPSNRKDDVIVGGADCSVWVSPTLFVAMFFSLYDRYGQNSSSNGEI